MKTPEQLRRRIGALMWLTVSAVMVSVLMGGFWFFEVLESFGSKARQESVQLLQFEEALGATKTQLLEQTREWKNSLLRAHKPAEFALHQAEFKTRAVNVTQALASAKLKMQALGMDSSPIDTFSLQHEHMLTQYQAALRLLDPKNPQSYRAVDESVSHIDRQLLHDLETRYAYFDQLISDRIASFGRNGDASLLSQRWVELGALAVLLPLFALGAFLVSHNAMRQLGRVDRRARAIFEAIGDAVLVVNVQGEVESLNTNAQQLLGWSETDARGKPLSEVFHIVDMGTGQPTESPFEQVLRSQQGVALAKGKQLCRPDGSQIAIEDSAAPVFDSRGQLFCVVIVFHDVSERYAILKDLQRERGLWQRTFDYAAVGMAHLSRTGTWSRVNRKLCEMTGYTEAELLAMSFRGVTHPDDVGNDLKMLGKLMAAPLSTYAAEKRYIRKDGQIIWVSLTISAVMNEEGQPEIGVSIIEDITEQKKAALQIEHMAYHDQLTGLANRRLLQDRMAQAISNAVRQEAHLALLYIDLDHFKLVNDSLGHPVGDLMLLQVAQRLLACVRTEDTVARVGGDEFVVMLGNIQNAEVAAVMAEKIIAELTRSMLINSEELRVTPSIGISICPQDSRDANDMLKYADAALYQAKQFGRATYRFYTKSLNDDALERLNIERLLHKALELQEFELHYQSQVNLQSGCIVGCEALIRWNHPVMGLVLPGRFIPIAEHSNLINQIGAWVMHQACLQAKIWQDQGFDLKVSFNVSARQFMRPVELMQDLRSALACGVDPTRMGIELTESLLLDPHRMGEVLDDISALGIKISLDDFGTGFSSLSYLRRFPINTLKIDQSFVSQADENADDAEMVKTIIGMAHNLRMHLVAEGVETAAQGQLLAEHLCEVAQGYHFSKPLPVAEFQALLAR
jgi:diguanylate cyclase (GGDEF)-like protein/PAS domain S-box-containing protein